MQLVINTFGSYLRKKEGNFLVKTDDQIFEVSAKKVQSIMITTSAFLSTDAIKLAMEVILKGQKRLLITMATGTGKTAVAFQLCWKLWNARWNRTGEYRRPKILYLADCFH